MSAWITWAMYVVLALVIAIGLVVASQNFPTEKQRQTCYAMHCSEGKIPHWFAENGRADCVCMELAKP